MIIDLSHRIENGMTTYQGLPEPFICDFWTREKSAEWYDDGSSFHIGRIDLVANTGTYVDVPFHRYADGMDVAGFPIDGLANLPGVLIDCRRMGKRSIGPEVLPQDTISGKAVLFLTGWDAYWRTNDYQGDHPYLSEQLARELVDRGAELAGIDSYNIDDSHSNRRPVHTLLLGNNIPIVEHMTGLNLLAGKSFVFTAAPPRIEGMGSFPVRAFAVIR